MAAASLEAKKQQLQVCVDTVLIPIMTHDHLKVARELVRSIMSTPEVQKAVCVDSMTQQHVFLVVRLLINKNIDKGRFQCAITAHLIGDALNEFKTHLKAIGAFCVALTLYEEQFKETQKTLRAAMEAKEPTDEIVILAMDISNKHSTCCANMSFAFSQLGRIDSAIEAAKRGLSLCPPMVTALGCMRRVATGFMEKENFEEAGTWWEKVIASIENDLTPEERQTEEIQKALGSATQSRDFCRDLAPLVNVPAPADRLPIDDVGVGLHKDISQNPVSQAESMEM